MTTYALGGWSFGVTLESLLDEARAYAKLGSASIGYAHLGTTSTIQQTRVAEFVNRSIEEITEKNPILGISATAGTISLVSGTTEYAIPTTLHGLAIKKLRFQDASPDVQYDLREIPYWGQSKVSQLPPEYKNGEASADFPEGWSFNETGAKVRFYPKPSNSSVVVEVFFRAEPTEVTQANVASPSAVTLSEIPVRFRDVYALRIAMDLLEPENTERAEWLRIKYSGVPRDPTRPGRLREMQRTLANLLPANKAGSRDDSMPTATMNEREMFRFSLIKRF